MAIGGALSFYRQPPGGGHNRGPPLLYRGGPPFGLKFDRIGPIIKIGHYFDRDGDRDSPLWVTIGGPYPTII
jgi:hypothetical protein